MCPILQKLVQGTSQPTAPATLPALPDTYALAPTAASRDRVCVCLPHPLQAVTSMRTMHRAHAAQYLARQIILADSAISSSRCGCSAVGRRGADAPQTRGGPPFSLTCFAHSAFPKLDSVHRLAPQTPQLVYEFRAVHRILRAGHDRARWHMQEGSRWGRDDHIPEGLTVTRGRCPLTKTRRVLRRGGRVAPCGALSSIQHSGRKLTVSLAQG